MHASVELLEHDAKAIHVVRATLDGKGTQTVSLKVLSTMIEELYCVLTVTLTVLFVVAFHIINQDELNSVTISVTLRVTTVLVQFKSVALGGIHVSLTHVNVKFQNVTFEVTLVVT